MAQGVLRGLDALEAQLRFEADAQGRQHDRLDTTLLELDEALVVDTFLQGRAELQQGPRIASILGRLCCPEAPLVEELLRRGVAHVPEELVHQFRSTRRGVYRLVFVACAHREAKRYAADVHRFVCSAITDLQGHLSLRRAYGPSEEISGSAADCCRLVFESAARQLGGEDQGENEHCELFLRRPAEPSQLADDAGVAPSDKLVDRCMEALLAAQPLAKLTASGSDVEECNDGEAFRTTWYETTLFRRGFMLSSSG